MGNFSLKLHAFVTWVEVDLKKLSCSHFIQVYIYHKRDLSWCFSVFLCYILKISILQT